MHGFRYSMEDAMDVKLGMGEGKEDWGFFAIFDGHAGDQASEYLSKNLFSKIVALEDPTDHEALKKAVCEIDSEFLEDEHRRDDGSTCIFAICKPNQTEPGSYDIIVSNTGDSRAMIIRQGTGECVSLSEDHKPSNKTELDRIEAANGTVEANRVDGGLALSRAIGDWESLWKGAVVCVQAR